MQKFREKAMHVVFFISALVSIFAVALICIFLFANGIPAIMEIGLMDFLFGAEWAPADDPASYGIWSMILGSLYVTAGAIIIGVPIGVLTAMYMATSCPPALYKKLKPAVNLLAGIPSVVYGFFGMIVLVPIMRTIFPGNGNSMLTSSILLGIMILPTVIGIAEASIRQVPDQYYEGALALGASHERSIFMVVAPAAKSGIFAAVVLGIGRAIGETMAVIMVAGNQARTPDSIFDGVRTLTANIAMEMGYAEGLHREALIATGCVLFVFILIINFSFAMLNRRRS